MSVELAAPCRRARSSGCRIDPPEFRLQGAPHKDGESGGHLDARWAGAHQDERQEIGMAAWIFFCFG